MLSGILMASIHIGRLKIFRKVNTIKIRLRMQAKSFRYMLMVTVSPVLVKLADFCFAQSE